MMDRPDQRRVRSRWASLSQPRQGRDPGPPRARTPPRPGGTRRSPTGFPVGESGTQRGCDPMSQPRFFPVPHPNRSAQRLDIHRGIRPVSREEALPQLNAAASSRSVRGHCGAHPRVCGISRGFLRGSNWSGTALTRCFLVPGDPSPRQDHEVIGNPEVPSSLTGPAHYQLCCGDQGQRGGPRETLTRRNSRDVA
jgi:hypothetical protein